MLSGTFSDPDVNDSLTFVWDNMSRGPQQSIPVPDDTRGALFWRLLPDTTPVRTFPRISDVIANINANVQEQLPTHPRVMDFRLTVNDNHKFMYKGSLINASGINSADKRVVVAAAGPFEVTSQNTPGISYPGGSDQLVTWNVNGTDTLPVNTQEVTISLSTDGGYTYPVLLTDSATNTGSAVITLPNIDATDVRVKIAATNSIYFDINTMDFEIFKTSVSAINEYNNLNVKVYPNPARDFIMIAFEPKGGFSVRLYNLNTQLIAESINDFRVNTSHLAEGVYFVEIYDHQSAEKAYKKVVIKN